MAAAAISGAETDGAEPGSLELLFRPHRLMPGDYRFDIGTAGSTGLVLQTVLPALLTAPAASRLTLLGGTPNRWCRRTLEPARFPPSGTGRIQSGPRPRHAPNPP